MNSLVPADASDQTGTVTSEAPAWDPYEVWRTRVHQPRRRSAQLRQQEERAGETISPAAGRSRSARWNPWRRATYPRS